MPQSAALKNYWVNPASPIQLALYKFVYLLTYLLVW